MRTFQTLAEIGEDGTLTAHLPASSPAGPRRVVIVVDDADTGESPPRRKLPDLTEFRASLEGKPYPGNSVVDMRARESR